MSVDGGEAISIQAGTPRAVPVTLGQHIVTAKAVESGERWKTTVEVKSQGQEVVSVGLVPVVKAPPRQGAVAAPGPGAPGEAGRVSDRTISIEQLDAKVASGNYPGEGRNLAEQTYSARSKALEEWIHDTLLDLEVESRSTTRDDLVAREITQQDMSDAQALGVQGTPAAYVDGRSLGGAVPFEKIKELIDDELARKGLAPPP